MRACILVHPRKGCLADVFTWLTRQAAIQRVTPLRGPGPQLGALVEQLNRRELMDLLARTRQLKAVAFVEWVPDPPQALLSRILAIGPRRIPSKGA
ncbi:MAG: hypothetical protein R3185_02810 [Candidatus Thermoplasmatota archaeon]|nr:hypothetical protein [Candidatus Thermoplasmatota archaeon]